MSEKFPWLFLLVQQVRSFSGRIPSLQNDSVILDDDVLLISHLESGALGRAVSDCAGGLGAQVQ